MKAKKSLSNILNIWLKRVLALTIFCILFELIVPIITNLNFGTTSYAYKRPNSTSDPYESWEDNYHSNASYHIIENKTEHLRYYIETFRVHNNGYSYRKIASVEIMDYNVTEINIPDKIRYANQYFTIDSLKNTDDFKKSKVTNLTIPNLLLRKYNFYINHNNIKVLRVLGNEGSNGIQTDMFREYKNLNAVDLININTIGDYAFAQLKNLTRVSVYNDNVKKIEIGTSAFFECTSLSLYTHDANSYLKSVGDYAFYGCRNLTSTSFAGKGSIFNNDYLNYIGEHAFEDCEKYSSYIQISKNAPIKVIGEYAFCNTWISSFYIYNSGITTIKQYTCANCRKLLNVVLSNSITKIENNAFYYSAQIVTNNRAPTSTWEIPNSVTYIGSNAFYGCSKVNVKINKFKSIGINAFKNFEGKIKSDNWPGGFNEKSLKNGDIYPRKTISNTTVQKNTKTTPGSTQKANNSKNSVEKSNNKNNTKESTTNKNSTSQNVTNKNVTNKNTTAVPKDTTSPIINSSITSDKTKAILTWSATDNVGITGYKMVKQANAGNTSGYTQIKSTKSLSNVNQTFYENGIWYLYVKDARRKFFLYKNNSWRYRYNRTYN